MKIYIVSIILLLLSSLLFVSCTDKIDILQSYDFSLTTMPVQKRIKKGDTAEIRCSLVKSGHYNGAKFTIGYFQSDGKGVLRLDDGTELLPNDTYTLDRSEFRLYYTSACTDQQVIDLTVRDNFGQRYDLTISWQNETTEQTK